MRLAVFWLVHIFLLSILASSLYAAEVRSTRVYQQKNRIIIEYDLESDKAAAISAVFSINGKYYTEDKLHLEGDINKNVDPGRKRRFRWNVLQDFPQGYLGTVSLKLIPVARRINESQLLPTIINKQKLYGKVEASNQNTPAHLKNVKVEPSFSALASSFDETVIKSYVDEIDRQKLDKLKFFCSKFKDFLPTNDQIDAETYSQLLSADITLSSDEADKYFNCILSLLDPHSSFMSAEAYKKLKSDTKGLFGGLGIEIVNRDGVLTINEIVDDTTPAHKAGLKAGDQILRIDGKLTKGMHTNEVVKMLRGVKGTNVALTIMRAGFDKPGIFTMERDIIQTNSVYARLLHSGYGYLRIAKFQENTDVNFAKALKSLEAENKDRLSGLILDLRNDSGGLLIQAVKVADRFIDNGLIVSTRARTKESKMRFSARKSTKEPKYPLVVLINGGSASAAEILAGALQDHKRAIIAGMQSFGKGTVQTVIPLPEETGLRLTTTKYYTPLGRSIQAKGITPDVIVEPALVNSDAIITFAELLMMKSAGVIDPLQLAEIASQVKSDNFFKLYPGAVNFTADIKPSGNEPVVEKSIWSIFD